MITFGLLKNSSYKIVASPKGFGPSPSITTFCTYAAFFFAVFTTLSAQLRVVKTIFGFDRFSA